MNGHTGELHILLFCAPHRMDAEIPAVVHIGGSRFGKLAGRR